MMDGQMILVSVGQDCSTLLLMRYIGLQKHICFFDRIAVYSNDYLQMFSKIITNVQEQDVKIFVKDRFQKLLETYNNIIKNPAGHRVNFHAFVGDKYSNIYVDNVHIDDKELVKELDLTSFYTFLTSLQDKVSKVAVKRIMDNIKETRDLMQNHSKDNILFLRTIKHEMTNEEVKHLDTLRKITKKWFPNSRVVVITDVESNANLDKDIIYFKFDHWKKNEKDKEEFLKLLKKRGILT